MLAVLETELLPEMSEPCGTCGGAGRVGGVTCPICAGSCMRPGSQHFHDMQKVPLIREYDSQLNDGHGVPCPVCSGTGFVTRDGDLVYPCGNCTGGRIYR